MQAESNVTRGEERQKGSGEGTRDIPEAYAAEFPSAPGHAARWQPWPPGMTSRSVQTGEQQPLCSAATIAQPQTEYQLAGAAEVT